MQLSFNEYKKKVYGCFVGKCVGGTLGMKWEGNRNYNEVTYYDPIPDKMLPNDDLDLQVVHMEAILKHGLPVSRYTLAENWKYHVADTAPDEYGCSVSNHALKIFAPLSGSYRNKMFAGMGGAIRSEIWACLAPANVRLSSTFAREDACCDHTKEGIHAEMFLAAMESLAFIESDLNKLIEAGLSVIPNDSKLKHAFLDVIAEWENSKDLLKVRSMVLEKYPSPNWTDVTINLSFILLALLACEDSFDKAICTAVSLGYDADCTGATVGSLFGIINPDGIGEKWTSPIGNALVLSPGVVHMHAKPTIDDFCDQIISVADSVQEFYQTGINLNLPEDFPKANLSAPHAPSKTSIYDWEEDAKESLISINPLLVSLVYPERVAAIPDTDNNYTLKIENVSDLDISGSLTLNLPDYWEVTPKNFSLSIKKGEKVQLSFTVKVDGRQKRMPLNTLLLAFKLNGLSYTLEAGLPISYPWKVENLETGETYIYEADSVFFSVPKGKFKYTAKLFSPMIKDIRIHASGERHFKFLLNGNELYDSADSWYGTFYAPTFHRSGFMKPQVERGDNIIEVLFLDEKEDAGEFYMGFSTIYGCAVWIDTFERHPF